MGRKSRSSKEQTLPEWVDILVGSETDSKKKQHLQTQADVVLYDLSFRTIILQLPRVFAAVFISIFLLLLLFGSTNGVIYGGSLTYGILVGVCTYLQGSISGLPANPTLYICFMAPFWTAFRAPKGSKLSLMWRSVELSIVWGGVILLAAWTAQLATSKVAPTMTFTIPLQVGPVVQTSSFTNTTTNNTLVTTTITETGDSQRVLYATMIAIFSVWAALLMWYDVLGVGEWDGAWVPWSQAKDNLKRANWDRTRSALNAMASTLFINQILGVALVLSPEYLFATWTQHTTMVGTDYDILFAWSLGSVAMTVGVVLLMSIWFSDIMEDWMSGIHIGSGGPRKVKYNREKKREKDSEVEMTETADAESTDEDSDS